MKTEILMAWVGQKDFAAAAGKLPGGQKGPIAQAIGTFEFDQVHLLSNWDKKKNDAAVYLSWIKQQAKAPVEIINKKLSGPTEYREIYEACLVAINEIKEKNKNREINFTFHLSPGTPAMCAVWIIISKTVELARLIESSPEAGTRVVDVPFEISADYIARHAKQIDDDLIKLTQGLAPEVPEFGDIIHKCADMKRLVVMARKIAIFDVPVLLQGETGTGKELFARAIHASGKRKDKTFKPVNCGAIPDQLVESELFGHVKGAFTGAEKRKDGYFHAANGGSIFLDEIGELSLQSQVKILRVLQEEKIIRIGSTESEDIDVRIIAATNKNLMEEVSRGRFRQDLFHRLAVGVMNIPPLRERPGDLSMLIDHILDKVNRNFSNSENWKQKKLSAGARNLILQHRWPGNVRELENTLTRLMIWSPDETIREKDVRESLFTSVEQDSHGADVLNRPLDGAFNVENVIAEVARHYIERALKDSGGNKTKAAKLLGLTSYQRLSDWMKKYGIDGTQFAK